MSPDLEDRLAGSLLGTAVGDALGLPCEGLPPDRIARWFPDLSRYHLVGNTGFVSDDTEQSALVAMVLCSRPTDPEACAALFRRLMQGWFLRLPFGVGLATVRACSRSLLGLRPTGVASAGNGAAMRSAVIGVAFRDDPFRRRAFTGALARVTHTDERAVRGAQYVADVAAACAANGGACPRALLPEIAAGVSHPELQAALQAALTAAEAGVDWPAGLRPTGYVVHTLAAATFCFAAGDDPALARIQRVIRAGGDTDTIAAIVGGWCGALGGCAALPGELVAGIHDGPFGPTHLRALAVALARTIRCPEAPAAVPGFSAGRALGRNLLLIPVVLAHGLRRVFP